MELLATFSQLILDLYQAVERVEPERFRAWAFDRLRQSIVFDAAVWIQGVVLDGLPVTTRVYLHHLPNDMLQDYARWASDDDLFAAVRRTPLRCVRAADLIDWPARRETAMYREYLSTYGIEDAIGILIPFGVSGIQSFLTLYRNNRDQPFTTIESDWFEGASPHLVEAENIGSLRHVRRRHRVADMNGAIAVVSTDGHLKMAEMAFVHHLTAGWPDWKPPWVPPPILGVAERTRPGGLVINQYYAHSVSAAGDYVFLLRPATPLDLLTPREREIATRIADGMPYKKVATELGISPSTVTNHVNAIHEKLAVTSSAALRRAIGIV